MLAARLGIPVVPVRLTALDHILHKDAKFPTPGRAGVKFGAPLRPSGDDAAAIAKQVEDAVRSL
jgi:1-acyl-sn-glycerol-3-phosphate acyltransferase